MTVVPRLWPGETVVCIASGPSLVPADVDYCRGKARVIAVNDAYRVAPWADVLYACDERWWNWHKGATEFAGLKYGLTCVPGKWPGVQTLRSTGDDGLELSPDGIRTGRNSGYQAMNVAVHLGATQIVLLGYDMQRGPKGERHWHGDHPNHSEPPYLKCRSAFATLVKPLAEIGVAVVNCTRRTALTAFPCQPLESVL